MVQPFCSPGNIPGKRRKECRVPKVKLCCTLASDHEIVKLKVLLLSLTIGTHIHYFHITHFQDIDQYNRRSVATRLDNGASATVIN